MYQMYFVTFFSAHSLPLICITTSQLQLHTYEVMHYATWHYSANNRNHGAEVHTTHTFSLRIAANEKKRITGSQVGEGMSRISCS